MMTVLISGATGMVGKELTRRLTEKGYTVRGLTLGKDTDLFHWNPKENYIAPKAFENLNAIIHLAGAPISEKWSENYKKELHESRIKTADLLFEYVQKYAPNLRTFITASGSNYYGTFTSTQIFTESEPNGNDFPGKLCQEWENAAFQFEKLNSRVVALRTAAVLSEKGGMLKKLMPLVKLNLASPLGSGKQILPWIHLSDLVEMYIFALENENLKGAYNAAAPQIINNEEFTKSMVKSMHKTLFLPKVPAFILKFMLGEMSSIVLEGSVISSEKIQNAGFEFKFPELNLALNDLIQ